MMMEYSHAILVDGEGHFMAALRWPADQLAPNFNRGRRPNSPKATRKHLLFSEYAIENVTPDARWDFKPVYATNEDGTRGELLRDGTWHRPEKVYVLVDEKGQQRGKRKLWPDRVPPPPFGQQWVDVEPPKTVSTRFIWNGSEWVAPRVVGLVSPEGVLENTVLENPRDDQPNVETPPGWSRVDERDWPKRGDGNPVGIGDRREKGGAWSRPDRPGL